MNWVTTNVRLPEETYMEIRMEAARRRKSMAAIVRERLFGKRNVKMEVSFSRKKASSK